MYVYSVYIYILVCSEVGRYMDGWLGRWMNGWMDVQIDKRLGK
jgi:hypothetical protein